VLYGLQKCFQGKCDKNQHNVIVLIAQREGERERERERKRERKS